MDTDATLDAAVLLAVCDVLAVKALETMGKWIVRTDRARFNVLADKGLPLHKAHLLWQPVDEVVSRATRGAWDVVPAMLSVHGCCGVKAEEVTSMLDRYVHDLVITGTPHSTGELRYRFGADLDLHVPLRQPVNAT